MNISRREALKITAGAGLAGLSGLAGVSPASGEVTPLGGLIPTSISLNSPGEITPGDTRRQIRVSVSVAETLADELLKNGQDIPTPTGSVKLRFGDFGTVTQAVKRGGIAFALDWLPAGTHDLEVIYPGQGRFDSCRSGIWSLEVRVLIDTETHLFVNGTSAIVTVTAADSSTPTGQALLSYPHGGAPTPTLYQDLVNGSATFDLSFFPPGKHAVQAAYCKQRGHYYPSTSNVETVTVRRPRGR